MNTPSGAGPGSMRFELHEVLSGMLGSVETDTFTDDVARLAAMFESLAGNFSLFAPLAAGVDPAAVGKALQMLQDKNVLQHVGAQYALTAEGRAACRSSKRTLFNKRDVEQLEEAAKVFDKL